MAAAAARGYAAQAMDPTDPFPLDRDRLWPAESLVRRAALLPAIEAWQHAQAAAST